MIENLPKYEDPVVTKWDIIKGVTIYSFLFTYLGSLIGFLDTESTFLYIWFIPFKVCCAVYMLLIIFTVIEMDKVILIEKQIKAQTKYREELMKYFSSDEKNLYHYVNKMLNKEKEDKNERENKGNTE
jgi:hypothetical protein